MSDAAKRFHELWLGMVQPVDGLVVSTPVLLEAQCMERQPPQTQHKLRGLCEPLDSKSEALRIRDLGELLGEMLEMTPDLFDGAEALPEDLSLYVQEAQQTIRPTMALRRLDAAAACDTETSDAPSPSTGGATDRRTPHSIAGERYVMLVWQIPSEVDLDKPETATGPWEYPASAKFDRLLRNCRVPIGLVTNRRHLRLVYAPHGESSGSITFRIDDMASTGGRPILDAFMMLLSAQRFFGVAPEHQLPSLLQNSRKRQANVTNELAAQVLDAIGILLEGFEAAAERDGRDLMAQARPGTDDNIYGGLLTTLLRLVFLLYAEDRELLPVSHPVYARSMSVLELFGQLQRDRGAHPDSMHGRFGAWGRLLATFRAVYTGVRHGTLQMPPRRGELFDPNIYPFLEGWDPQGSAPVRLADNRAAVQIPSISDGTVYEVLKRLIIFDSQRLSYRALDVEQIGSVYEGLMGYHVRRLDGPAVCMRPERVWVTVAEVQSQPTTQRAKWLQQTTDMPKAQAQKLAAAIKAAKSDEAVLEAMEGYRAKGTERVGAGRLVLQPGAERRRTSSHYTPRSLSAPIVQRTLDPLIETMGKTPSSEQLLGLKICDPAMGSGAFLVEACRYLGDQVVAAWTRENKHKLVADKNEDVVNHARRLVAQRCLYGVDKNPFAVNLGKLSLWLVTLAKDLPFTFVDHSLRHGDSLVGLDFDQIQSFHWNANGQIPVCTKEVHDALAEAVDLRQRILDLAYESGPEAQREKERLLRDAEDALKRVRLIGDLVVGAYFAGATDKDRERERKRRMDMLLTWMNRDDVSPNGLGELQQEARQRVPAFHWMAEFPEIFYTGRQDPLATDGEPSHAYMDAFVGNPPFAGKNGINDMGGPGYLEWLKTTHAGAHGNADYCAHFFRRADALLGEHGTTGFIATNTISQGDTRTTGLKWLLEHGHNIFNATRSLPWPGNAAVTVAKVHLAKGTPAEHVSALELDDLPAEAINSRLRPKSERKDPTVLASNAGLSFQGSIVLGMGFTLTPEERDDLIKHSKRNAARSFPYIGGEEVNTHPEQMFQRYVINFGSMSLEEAGRWPDLLEIVREKVKPERDRQNDKVGKEYWWRFLRTRDELYQCIDDLPRCLVTCIVSKHVIFSFQPTDRVFSHRLYVFPLPAYAHFAILQSRVHEPWVWLLSSTMKTDLNYSATDCFETFPFPDSDPRTVLPPLEAIGKKLYEARAAYMRETDQGLTKTYNALKDPECADRPIVELRRLHEQMDRAVLDAYGWDDIEVPAFTEPQSDREKAAREAFEDEVIDRLFVLNAERAELELIRGQARRPAKRVERGTKGRRQGQSADASDAALRAAANDGAEAATAAHGSGRGPKRVGQKPGKQAERRRRPGAQGRKR